MLILEWIDLMLYLTGRKDSLNTFPACWRLLGFHPFSRLRQRVTQKIIRGSRLSFQSRPRARPRDSRGGGFDVLTKWSIVHSKCPEGDDVCISALNVVFHDVAFPGVFYLFLPFLPSSYFKHLSVYFKV